MPAKDHDKLFRSTFTDLRHARALLRCLLPAEIAAACDWDTLRVLPGSFIDSDLREHHTDILFGVQCKGVPLFLHLLLEHKANPDRYTALQVLRYVVRIHEWQRQQGTEGSRLSPVLPMVVYHGSSEWQEPTDTLQLLALDEVSDAAGRILLPYQVQQRFLLAEVTYASEASGMASGPGHSSLTPIGALTLLLLRHVREVGDPTMEGLVRRWLPLWQSAWRDDIERLGLLSLLNYLVSQLATSTNQIFVAVAMIHEDAIPMAKTIKEQWLAEGKAEGKVEGKAEAKAEVLLILASRRFGELPLGVAARIQTATPSQIEVWLGRIFDAPTLADLLNA